MWNQEQAVELCRKLEVVAPAFGAHIALTGGCLYKDGERKDVDILVYRIRQESEINFDGLFDAFKIVGVEKGDDYGWCVKAKYQGKDIDFFFPEREEGGDEYPC